MVHVNNILNVQIMTRKWDSSWIGKLLKDTILERREWCGTGEDQGTHIKDGIENAWILGWNSCNREPNSMSYWLKQHTQRRNNGKTRNTKIWNLLISKSHLLSYCIMHMELMSSPHMLLQLQVIFPYAT